MASLQHVEKYFIQGPGAHAASVNSAVKSKYSLLIIFYSSWHIQNFRPLADL